MRRRRERKRDGRSFLQKLHNPPNWVAVITVAGALVVCPLLIAAIVVNRWRNMSLVIGILLCVILAAYTVVVIVNLVRKARLKVLNVADRYAFTRNLRNDYLFRTLIFGLFSFVCNVGYTAFLMLTAFRYKSVWYGAIGVYYILLSISRGGVLLQSAKDEKKYRYDAASLQNAKLGTYRYCGVMMLTLAFSLTLSVLELVFGGEGFRLELWQTFIFGGVALYKAGVAVRHFFHATKMDDLAVRAARYINLAVTLMSLLCVQTSLLAALSILSSTKALFNGITGGIVCGATWALGVYMLVFASRVKKKIIED